MSVGLVASRDILRRYENNRNQPSSQSASFKLGHGTMALDPTFGSFTLLEPVSTSFRLGELVVSLVKVLRLFRLEWIVLVFRVWTQ